MMIKASKFAIAIGAVASLLAAGSAVASAAEAGIKMTPDISLPRCRHRITQDVAAITDLGATRHCLDLDLAHDLGGALT